MKPTSPLPLVTHGSLSLLLVIAVSHRKFIASTITSMTEDWRGDILARLKIRDELESRDSQYFVAFDLLRRKKAIESNAGDADVAAENERLIQKLNGLAIEVEKKDSQITKLKKQLSSADNTIKSQQNKLESLELKVQEKNKNIEIVNDEFLMNQIQTAVLQKKVDELTKENEMLVKRWMDRVSSEAQQMNDANQFLESMRKGSG
jgi:autophagy-related protein 16